MCPLANFWRGHIFFACCNGNSQKQRRRSHRSWQFFRKIHAKKYFSLPIGLFFDKRIVLLYIKITIGNFNELLMEKKGGEQFEGY
jgi:hypothetical protein